MDTATPAPLAPLYAALAKAQGEISNAEKNAENPHFKSSYADLGSIWNACRPALAANGLCVIQRIDSQPGGAPGVPGRLFLETTLGHSSGAEISSMLPIDSKPGDHHGLGSALTYLRRYALAALVGVAPEDDDGSAAQGQQRPARAAPERRREAPAELPPEAQPEIDRWKETLDACVTLAELDDLKAALRVSHPKPADGGAEHPVVRVLAPAIKAKDAALKKVLAAAKQAGEAAASAAA